MQRSAVLILLLGCAVAAVVAVMATSGRDAILPPTRGSSGGGPSPEDPNENVSGGSVPSQTGSEATSYTGPVPADAPHVTIKVTEKERFVAPPSPPLLATNFAGEALPARVLAGVGAGFDAPLRARGTALVVVDVPGGKLVRQIARNGAASAPTRIGARVMVRGKVVDLERKPITTASVWLGELAVDGSVREFAVDEEGAFEADVPVSDGVPLVVRADGFASQWRSIKVSGQMGALTEMMQPAATVHVQLATRAVEMDKARAFVVSQGDVSSGVSQWPFFWQCLTGGYEVSDQGQVQIKDLPQNGTVGVLIRHPTAPLMAATKVKLGQKEVRSVVPLRMGSQMLGVVVDEEGNGVAGASLWALRAGQRLNGARSLRLLPPHLDVIGSCYAQAGADGHYVIGALDDERSVLSVRAHGYAGRDLSPASVQEEEIVLPKWRGGDAALHIQPPVAGKVWRVTINLGDDLDEVCDKDEPYVIALPYEGVFEVEMRLQVGGEQYEPQKVPRLMATGPVELVTPSPN